MINTCVCYAARRLVVMLRSLGGWWVAGWVVGVLLQVVTPCKWSVALARHIPTHSKLCRLRYCRDLKRIYAVHDSNGDGQCAPVVSTSSKLVFSVEISRQEACIHGTCRRRLERVVCVFASGVSAEMCDASLGCLRSAVGRIFISSFEPFLFVLVAVLSAIYVLLLNSVY